MAFEGGAINVIGVTPSFLSSLGTQTAQNGVVQGLGQVWQGAGQSFFGSAGQSLAGNLAGSAVNVALNSALGTQVAGPQGLKLTSGANLLASTITPYVTSQVAAGINQSIQKSLKSAGPFGPALSTLGTGLVNQATQGLTNAIFGGASPGAGGGNATNYKMFPGGGGEAAADYGGSSYTLTDVVFSLVPANQGPQQFGLDQATNFPKSLTTLPFKDYTKMPLLSGNDTLNTLKKSSMSNQLSQKTFSPQITNIAFGGSSIL
jgi:hypothetical protein